MRAVKIVAKMPITIPELIKAIGIERIPVPREAFKRCVRVSQSLKKKDKRTKNNIVKVRNKKTKC